MTPELESARDLLARTYGASLGNFSLIMSLKSVAQTGLATAFGRLVDDARLDARSLFLTPTAEQFFDDPQRVLDLVGGIEGFAAQAAAKKASDFARSINAASIIFCHSILDGTAYDYCRVTALASPGSWERFVSQKQATMEQVKTLSYGELLKQKIDMELSRLEMESLIKKLERLLSICQPEAGFNPFTKPFKFDMDRVVRLDRTRHDIVHGGLLGETFELSDEELLFHMNVVHFFMALISTRFSIQMDAETFVRSTAGATAAPRVV